MRPRVPGRRGRRAAAWLALLLALAVCCGCAAGQAPAPSQHNATAAATPEPQPHGPAPPPQHSAPATSGASSGLPPHKPLVPLDGADIGLFVVVSVALFIASGAGVGGGVLVVPALLIITRFNAVAAVALSNVTILASSVANMVFNLPRKSTLRAGPLIDWDLVLLFGPPTVVGAVCGSYINMVIPSWVTKTMLFLLLVPMAWRMIIKAKELYTKESAARRRAAAAQPVLSFDVDALTKPAAAATTGASLQRLPTPAAARAAVAQTAEAQAATSLGEHGKDPEFAEAAAAARAAADGVAEIGDQNDSARLPAVAKDVEEQPQLQAPTRAGAVKVGCWQRCDASSASPKLCAAVRAKLEAEEAAQLPWLQVGLLVLSLGAVIAGSLMAGYLVPCGSVGFWLLMLAPLLAMLLVFWVARRHVLWKGAWKTALDMHDAADLAWTPRSTLLYPAICISAGVIAGLLGLGGGLILTPLMLELGVNPAVSAASTQVTLLISSATAAIVYAVNGSVAWDYGLVLCVIGLVATLAGQWLVSWLVRRLGRPSILVITLALMFSAATAAALAVVVLSIIDLAAHPAKLRAHRGMCLPPSGGH